MLPHQYSNYITSVNPNPLLANCPVTVLFDIISGAVLAVPLDCFKLEYGKRNGNTAERTFAGDAKQLFKCSIHHGP